MRSSAGEFFIEHLQRAVVLDGDMRLIDYIWSIRRLRKIEPEVVSDNDALASCLVAVCLEKW